MKELDVLLEGYLERYYDTAPQQEQRIFSELLEWEDPQLLGYLMGRQTPKDEALAHVIGKIRSSVNA
jgi:succinate dehydrogenase flavin-adding protein (antitoxin of CptAB toxin-antitoxin module)